MTHDPFQEARERVTAREAAEYYGIKIDRHGKALCPFHPDKHPSMSFKGGRYRCWACDASGDAVDLVRGLYGLNYAEALQQVNQDFHLGLEVGGNLTPRQKAQARREREKEKALYTRFEAWREATIRDLCACIRVANRADLDNLTAQEAKALQHREQMEDTVDTLSRGTQQEKLELFGQRKGILLLVSSILPTLKAQ